MQRRLMTGALFLLLTAAPVSAKEIFLAIGGTVANFHTDMRIFNPSSTKDIQVQAYFLEVGSLDAPPDNSGVQPRTITVGKRQMVVFNDVLTALFAREGLGALRLKSDDDFVASQRIYAVVSGDTLGQFVPGLDGTAAKKKGVLIQLKNNGVAGAKGTFRTNIGALNPNAVAANVTWRVYDRNNALVGSPKKRVIPPFGVVQPLGIGTFGDNIPASADLSDAWVSYDSDQPLFAYGSVVDNGSTDPTFIPASEDSGTTVDPAPVPTARSIDVTLQNFEILFSDTKMNAGDTVTLHITNRGPAGHGFQLVGPTGSVLVADRGAYPLNQVIDKTFVPTAAGTYTYFCTQGGCGSGHGSMIGEIVVGAAGKDPSDRY